MTIKPERLQSTDQNASQKLNSEGSAYGEYIDRLRAIEGMNVDRGLALAGGSEKLYVSTLRTFTKRLPGLISATTCYLDEGDTKRFAVDIHGMKGSLATIGASTLSNLAFDLEISAKKGEINACKEMFPELLHPLSALHGKLWMVLLSKKHTPTEKGDVRRLKWQLEEIKYRLNEFDDETALDVLEILKGFDFGEEINDILITLSDHLEMLEYENAESDLDALGALLF